MVKYYLFVTDDNVIRTNKDDAPSSSDGMIVEIADGRATYMSEGTEVTCDIATLNGDEDIAHAIRSRIAGKEEERSSNDLVSSSVESEDSSFRGHGPVRPQRHHDSSSSSPYSGDTNIRALINQIVEDRLKEERLYTDRCDENNKAEQKSLHDRVKCLEIEQEDLNRRFCAAKDRINVLTSTLGQILGTEVNVAVDSPQVAPM